MHRRSAASAGLIVASVLTSFTTIATILLTVLGAENEHYMSFFLGLVLTIVWGLVTIGLWTASIMSLKDDIDYETLADDESRSFHSNEEV